MKTKILTLSIATVALLTAFTNKETVKSVTVAKVAETAFKMDAKASTIDWTGEKVTGKHTGNINFASGEFNLAKESITGGWFEVDMTSMTCTDMKGEYADKLLGHLKSEDFFSVEKNNKSKFVISSVAPLTGDALNNTTVTGKLTIKGITNDITFPANVKVIKGTVVAFADVKVDRTKYEIKYGSKNFFEGLGDKAISDEFLLKLKIVANK